MIANPTINDEGPKLTGLKVLMITLGFFGVVMIVNFGMAYMAIHTFSGMQTDKPYETGLAFNRAISDASAQAARGWKVNASLERTPSGLVGVLVSLKDAQAYALSGLQVSAVLRSPIDAKRDHLVTLMEGNMGSYQGETEAQAGQWDVEVEAKQDGVTAFRSINRVIVH